MFAVVRLLIAASIGAVVGLGSVWLALTDPRLDLAPSLGVWRVASGASDPYAAARAAREGALPLGAAEGVAFVARTDAAGARFNPGCHYVVEGSMPAGDLWTLAVTDEAGHSPTNPAGRIGFTSRDVIRRADGSIEIVVGPTARPGNYVPDFGLGTLVMTLRVYSSSIAADLPEAAEMPTVRLAGCAGGRSR